jgi:hypothetical protein
MADISSSAGYSTSTSTPSAIQTPQSNLELTIANAALSLGASQYSWAQQQFANSSAMTDAAVGSYLQFTADAQGLAENNIARYIGLFQPQENALVQEANQYASPERVALNMGSAASDAAQASNAARIAAEANLQSFGIDPSSGRYQELEQAQRAGAAATEAGAAQQAMLATENTGLQLRNQAIAVGQQYPGQAVNALNAANTGVTNAENAVLSNINTGTNALSSANPFLATAMSMKLPPVGNTSASQTRQVSSSYKPQNQPNQTSANKQAATTGAGISPPGNFSYGNNGAGGGGGGGAGAIPAARSGSVAAINNTGQPPGGNPGDVNGWAYDPTQNSSITDPSQMGIYPNGDPNAVNNSFAGQGASPSSTSLNDYNTACNNNPWGGATTYGTACQGNGNPSYGLNPQADTSANYNSANASDPWANPTTFGTACSNSYNSPLNAPTTTACTGTACTFNSGAGSNYGSACTGSACTGFASGGAIPVPTTGGFVPHHASPSMGQQTDDITAKLNAGEFVIPKDVAAWKGQEHFQKLIAQSRKALMQAQATGAHGKPTAPPSGPPQFQSRPMQGGI